jgi:hypothetical protein
MNRYAYEQQINIPTHRKKMRMVSGETENRMGSRPPNTAAETSTKPNNDKAMKSQPTPTPTAASVTSALLGVVEDRVVIGCW